jgi:hypothetical protein
MVQVRDSLIAGCRAVHATASHDERTVMINTQIALLERTSIVGNRCVSVWLRCALAVGVYVRPWLGWFEFESVTFLLLIISPAHSLPCTPGTHAHARLHAFPLQSRRRLVRRRHA